MSIIICRCGAWLKTASRSSARRCPACGRPLTAKGQDPLEGTFDPEAPRRPPRRRRRVDSFVDDLSYPFRDGPAIGLLAVFPPLLAFLSIPVFDIVRLFESETPDTFNPLALLVLPFATPLAITFTLFFGYVLLYLGRILVASSMGRDDHPRYPVWDWQTILEGVVRWVWAAVVGAGIGSIPLLVYLRLGGGLDWVGQGIALLLFSLGAGYAQMGLAAAILHDNVALANPLTIGRAIARIGPDYIRPCLTTVVVLLIGEALWIRVLYHTPDLTLAAVGLWLFWVYALYGGMVAMHSLGACYARNGGALGWFRSRPKWGDWERPGRIYQNS